jgi:hypothetical protein
MSDTAIRTAIKEVLNTVENIGVVHDYERHAATWEKFIELFRTVIAGQGQIRGWEITRRQRTGRQGTMGAGFRETERRHVYKLHGYLGLQDLMASEKTFQSLIDAICAAFADTPRLGGATNSHEFIQVNVIEPRMFGGVLCHFCEMSLTVIEPV